ncbi:MAG: GAF domain-containing protein, partial [Panacagrimonas sp.]
MEADEEHCEVDQDYARPGVASVVGRYVLNDFGPAAAESLREGRPFVIDDASSDARLQPATRARYRAFDVRALICVPLQRAGRLVAAMAIHHAAPRRWRQDEIALVHAVSHRCWESLERARAESERRMGDARFRALVEGAAQIVWTTDREGRVVEPLPSWCAFTGQVAAQVMGDGWFDAVHPDDRERVRRIWRQALESGHTFEGEFRVHKALDGWRWMHARGHAVVDDDGTVREWIGMNVDVSERKRIERRDAFLVRLDDAVRSLSDPEEVATSVLRLLGEHLHAQRATYLEVDAEGQVFSVVRDHAPGLLELHGRTFRLEEFGSGAGEALRGGRGFVTPDPAAADGSDLVGASVEEGGSAVLVVPLFRHRRLAAAVGLVRLMPRHWQEEEIDLARAVIHRAWESIERARLARDLREAHERKDDFIAMLAHELRNPLAPLRNGLQVLRRAPDAMPARRVHQMMERQVDQLVRLVDDLLDVSRITRGKMELRMEPQALSGVLTVALETARPLIEAARHRLEVDLPEREIHVRGDAVRLAQIFANLLNNAARYTDDGGRIRLRATRDGGRAVVSVRDSGIGLAPEMCERVFETFQQISRGPNELNSGLGIGLSLARSLTVLHDGRISAHSEGLGHGSEFVVSLPLIAEDTNEADANAPAGAACGAHHIGQRILVVDDNHDAADAFAALLRVLGADVSVCYRAADALAELERHAPMLAFLDLGMPEINGYELARLIRRHPRGH